MPGKTETAGSADGGPLAQELAEKLRRFLLTECRPGQKLPSEVQLSRAYGRSAVTVRKALATLRREGLLFRRRGSGTYASRNLPRITGATGILAPGSAELFLRQRWCREVFRGVALAAAEAGRHVQVIFGMLQKPYAVPDAVVQRIRLGHMDSIICVDLLDLQLMSELSRRMVTVSVDLACGVEGVSSCALQHEQCMELAVEHLWRLGHRRLSLVGALSPRDQDPATHMRRQGFLSALRARDLPVEEDAIADLSGPKYPQELQHCAQWAERWQRTPASQRATALVVVSDVWPLAYCLLRLGVRVPRDVSLVALPEQDPFDTWAEATRRAPAERDVAILLTGHRIDPGDPALNALRLLRPAAVSLPFAEMGRWAVEEVVRRVGDPSAEPRHATFPGAMVPGNTAALPPEQTDAGETTA